MACLLWNMRECAQRHDAFLRAYRRPRALQLTSNGHTAFVQVFIGSWNMGNAQPPQGPSALNNWIPPFGIDIYAIGVQACNALPQRYLCCSLLHLQPD